MSKAQDCTPKVSLPVLGPGPAMKRSRMSRRRAIVLIAIHAVMALNIIQWLYQGVTLAPVEPSESMYTLELGAVNTGFVLFAAAIASTFVFGRYFCGWACHVVALQDLCSHWMSLLGVRPKPFRTRLLMWWAMLLALYMFVWPSFKRLALFPLLEALGVGRPYWLKGVAAFPDTGFHPEFIVTDFWATFPPWYIAIPFLLICGFATVYFLGSKAFCTYGCPYGAIFAPVDRIAIGKIVVSDACHQCGHCTAACTSNVRVHQEVRDFGMVVDPGCMKCMDCVSVCPNDALSFGFARPSILAKPRTPDAKAGKVDRPPFDTTLGEEIVLLVAGVGLWWCFRQMFERVPVLMAAGLAMVATFAMWKVWRMLRDDNARVQNLQLKIKGRVTLVGAGFFLGTMALLGAAGWSGVIRAHQWAAELHDERVRVGGGVVFAPDYSPDPEDLAHARAALANYAFADSPRHGGWGWDSGSDPCVRRAWLAAVAGDLAQADGFMTRAIQASPPTMKLIGDLIGLRLARAQRAGQMLGGPSPDLLKDAFEDVLAAHPGHADATVGLAQVLAGEGKGDQAAQLARGVLHDAKAGVFPRVAAAELILGLGNPAEAEEGLRALSDRYPEQALVRASRARVLYVLGLPDEATREMSKATELEPGNIPYWEALNELLLATGQNERAEEVRKHLATLREGPPGGPGGR
jgi:polyferredoxin